MFQLYKLLAKLLDEEGWPDGEGGSRNRQGKTTAPYDYLSRTARYRYSSAGAALMA